MLAMQCLRYCRGIHRSELSPDYSSNEMMLVVPILGLVITIRLRLRWYIRSGSLVSWVSGRGDPGLQRKGALLADKFYIFGTTIGPGGCGPYIRPTAAVPLAEDVVAPRLHYLSLAPLHSTRGGYAPTTRVRPTRRGIQETQGIIRSPASC